MGDALRSATDCADAKHAARTRSGVAANRLGCGVVGHHDVGRFRWRDVGIEAPDDGDRDQSADELRGDEAGDRGRRDAGKRVGDIRPTVMAGLAKLVELVNQ